jgi:uncharacterized protein (TIGR02594 family)
MLTPDPKWLATARTYIGTREIPGPQHSKVIGKWLGGLGAWWGDDETPWCGVFIAAMLREHAIALPKNWFRARAWLNWGHPLPAPELGCITILERGPDSGHVMFSVGRQIDGRILGLGGNQKNMVRIDPFAPARVLGYRWPTEPWAALAFRGGGLPLFANQNTPSSTGEA